MKAVNEGSPSAQASGQSAPLRDYLEILRRRKWIVLSVTVLFVLGAAGYSLLKTPVYQASTDVLLTQDPSSSLTGVQSLDLSTQPDRFVQTQANLARGSEIAQRVIAQLRLQGTSVQDFLNHSSVSAVPNANVLSFAYQSTSADVATSVASAYAGQYIAFRHQLERDALEATRRQVQAQIDQLAATGDTRSALYASLVDKERQLATMEALQSTDVYVVRTSNSAVQVSPRPVRDVLLGFVLGLVVGIGLAFLREALDTRVRGAQAIANSLGLPLLARIPEPPQRLRTDNELVMLADPMSGDAEPYRILRTNVEFSTLDLDVRSIVFTSAIENEGKSTTVCNLAIALARTGKRVLLVDLDLRRPSIHRFFGLAGADGVTQAVLGHVPLKEAVSRVPSESLLAGTERVQPDPPPGASWHVGDWEKGRLDVLVAGAIPPDPGEFVASRALDETLGKLRTWYDLVLIDAPPMFGVGDAMALSARVDAMVVVVRIETARRGMLAELHRALQTTPAIKLGFVASGAGGDEIFGYSKYMGTLRQQE